MKKTSENINIAELLCSRLCHDIIAPLSAVNTGLELLEEVEGFDDSNQEDIRLLIKQSTGSALARLVFYRSAFGRGSNRMSGQDIQKIIENCYTNNKLKFTWVNILNVDTLKGEWGRAILNLLMVIGDCAPRGGQLTIQLLSLEEEKLDVALIANPLLISDEIILALKGELEPSNLNPRNIQAYLVSQLLCTLQAELSIATSENTIELEVRV